MQSYAQLYKLTEECWISWLAERVTSNEHLNISVFSQKIGCIFSFVYVCMFVSIGIPDNLV